MTVRHFTDDELKERYPLSMAVKSPADIKTKSVQDLEALAKEYRDYLIEICSRNGGHLGPGLGVIELTMALHKVYDSPRDKIVWDIGHQAYPHKLMTGRFVEIQALRKEDGISGFCRRPESVHDIFGAGHAGTSISAAIGVNEGHRRLGKSNKVVAVIGDAALTSGMAYEGLHQAKEYKKNVCVILNDNKMSIAPNVGAINDLFCKQMHSPFLAKLQDEVKTLASKIPVVGDEVVSGLKMFKNSMKNLVTPTVIFEALGFKYIGPIDGHDLETLIETLETVHKMEDPVVVHVVTEKGRGYAPAIADKETFHGCGPYDRESGKVIKAPNAPAGYNKVYGQTVDMILGHDPKAVAVTAAMPAGTGLGVAQKNHPDQYYDVGISEQHAVTFAGGLATEGIKPHVAIYSTFMQRAYDQIIHDICIQNLDVKFGLDRAGFVGADGATHNGNYDVAFMRSVPNMDVCAPKDERELQELIWAQHKHVGPSCVRYPRGGGAGLPLYTKIEDIKEIKWGTGELAYLTGFKDADTELSVEWLERLVKSQKKSIDAVLVGYGSTVSLCVQAAKKIYEETGMSILVVNLRFVKPLDEELLLRVAELSQSMITVEEHVLNGGVGSAVMEFYESKDVLQNLRFKRLGIPDLFYEQASVEKLRKLAGIDVDSIASSTEKLIRSTTKEESRQRSKATA